MVQMPRTGQGGASAGRPTQGLMVYGEGWRLDGRGGEEGLVEAEIIRKIGVDAWMLMC